MAAPAVGETFGPYRVESILGRGGMGTVYLATHARLERRVALKVIVPGLADDDAFRERFLRESRLVASLDHPHVVPVYDADDVDGVLFIAMRYVPGPSLRALLLSEETLPLDETARIAEQVGGALDAAHAAGLVHRDVKPANILLAEPGRHAYLCDFGLARLTAAEGATRTGSFLGTADYAAPEQIEGRPVDGRADVYALGGVLFHCLAGRPPFARDSEFATLRAHLEDEPPAAGLSPALDGVLRKALEKRPDDRYATAGELAAALGEAGEATRPPREPATRVMRAPRGRRRPGALAVLAAVALALAAGAVWLTGRGGSNEDDLQTFVARVENLLDQSASGRADVGAALAAGLRCTIAPRVAAQRIASAADENRRTVLAELDTTRQPTRQAVAAVTELQRALQSSIEADRHYRDAFLNVGATPHPCVFPQNADLVRAGRADAQATDAKQAFVTLFNPLAARFGARQWKASEF
jgi:predicted Ser/Thr protein kinase